MKPKTINFKLIKEVKIRATSLKLVVSLAFIFTSIFLFQREVNGQACPTSGTVTVNTSCTGGLTTSSNLTINPGVTLTVAGGISFTNNATLTVNGNLVVTSGGGNFSNNGTLTLNSPSASSITGDFNISNNGNLNIASGASLAIIGNVTASNNGPSSINGSLAITGNFTGGNNANMTGGGSVTTTGSFSSSSNVFGVPYTTCTSNCNGRNNCSFTNSITPTTSNICSSGTVVLTATTNAASPSYQWQSSTTVGGTYSNVSTGTGGTTATYTSAALSSNIFYRLNVTSSSCTGTSNTSSITVGATPTAVLAGSNPTICPGGSASFTVTFTGKSPYNFTYTDGTTPVALTNVTSPYTLTVSPASTKTYTISSASDACGISAASPSATGNTVTVSSLPSFSVNPSSGTQNRCQNGTATALSVTAAAGSGTISKYDWYSNTSASTSGGTLVATTTTTSTTNNYTPLTTSVGTLYYYCIVTNSNGCTRTSSVSGAITVNALPSVSITGSTPVCVGSTTTLSPTSGGTWTSSNTGLATVNASSGVVTGVAVGSPTFTFTSSTSPNCAATTSAVSVVAAPTVTPGTAINLTQTCSPVATTLTGASVGGSATTGAWSIASGTGTLSSTAQTASPATVTYTPLANTTGTVTLTLTSNSSASCNAATGNRTITIANATPTIANYLFNDNVTAYGSLTNSNAVTGVTITPSGPTFTNPTTGVVSGANAFTTNSTAGNFYNSTASMNTTPLVFTITSSTTPKTILRYKSFKVYFQAKSTTSASQITVNYSLNGAAFTGTSIVATVGANPTVTNTSTYTQALLTIPVAANQPTTSLAFRLQSNNGNAIQIENFQVQAQYIPITNITPTASSSTVCSGNSTNIQIANSEVGVTYQLRNDADNSNIGTSVVGTGSTINLPTGNLSSTTTYNVLASDGTGCSIEMSNTVVVSVNPTPTVTPTNPASVCSPITVDLTSAAVTSGSTGGLTYTYWTDAGATTSLSSPSAVNTTGTYYIKGTTSLSCSATSSVNVTVNSTPSVSVSPATVSICTGGSTSIVANADAGNAVSFSGTNQYVQFSSSPLQSSTDFTFEAMIYWTGPSTSSWQRIFDIGSSTTVNMFLTTRASQTGLPRYAITVSGNGGEQQINSSTAITTNAWHHIAVTMSGTTGTMYIDGVVVGTTTGMTLNPSSLGTPSFSYLGESQYVADPNFAGNMDEIRFWNVARTTTEINSNKGTPIATNTTGLTAYYRMNEGSGTSLVSVYSGGPSGTIQGGATWTTSTAPITSPLTTTFTWSPSTGLNTTTGATVTASPTNATTAATTTTYTVTGTYLNGCSSTATSDITINPVPVITNQTVTTCSGTAFMLTPSGVPSGTTYTWTTPTGTGFTGGSAQATGQSSISQTLTNSGSSPVTATYTVTPTSGTCVGSTFTVTVTINPLPSAISGLTGICRSSTTVYTSLTSGGTWSSANTSVATVSTTGIVTGISTGTAVISYTLSTGCFVSQTITVNTSTGTIVSLTPSSPSICATGSTTLTTSPSTSGGTWSSSNASVATVSGGTTNNNTISGVVAGTTIVNWFKNNGTCNVSTTSSVTVNALPVVSITGSSAICVGGTTSLSPTTGGTWSSSNTGLATVTNAGVVTGVSGGSPTFTFTQTSTGCLKTTSSVTVNALPVVSITGSSAICVGGTTSLSPTTGGTWSSSNTGLATVTNAGVVTGVSGGSPTFTFTQTSTGCLKTTSSVTVNALPVVSITGSSAICVGGTTSLSPTTGGTWSSSNTGLATVTIAGVVTGVSGGSPTFTFLNSTTNCSNNTSSVTVNALPVVSITGSSAICVGGTTSLSPTTGGTWSSSNTGLATVTNAGVVTGVSGGSPTFTFTQTSTGCLKTTSSVTVNALPVVSITGSSAICVGGTTSLSPTTGGTWSSSNTGLAAVTNAGVVTGVSGGSPTFTFTQTSTGCLKTTTAISINQNPTSATIAGTATICSGNTTNLTVTMTGGSGLYTVNYSGGTLTSYASGANIPVSPTVNTTYTLSSVTDANGCVAQSLLGSAVVTLDVPGKWVGSTSDWHTASNWCGNVVPTSTTDVTINSGSTAIISTLDATVNSISIGSGMSVQVDNSHKLDVSGNWSNSGTFTPGTGTVDFVGSSQAISNTNSGTENFYNLTISGSGTKTISTGTDVSILSSGTLTLGTGVTFDLAGRTLTLKSSAGTGFIDNTARLAIMPSGAAFVNASNFKVERYIPSGRRTLRYLASPVSGATVADWANGMYITGNKASYPDNTILNSTLSTVTDYTETLNGLSSQKFTEVYGLGTTLVPGKGYRAFVRGGRDLDLSVVSPAVPFATATTLYVKGTPNVGNITRNLTYTNHSKATEDGYNLVGNPYASAIDWDLVQLDGVNLPMAFSIFDPELSTNGANGAYYTYSSGVGVPARANPSIIPSFQSFFVKMTASGSVTFKESHKSSSIPRANFRVNLDELLRVRISDTSSYDEAAVQLMEGSTTAFDSQFDAYKISNSGINIYTVSSKGENLAINRTPNESVINIPLGVSNKIKGSHKLSFVNDITSKLYLDDNYLHTSTEIVDGTVYPFEITTDVNSSSMRFVLTNKPSGVVTTINSEEIVSNTMRIYPNPTDGKQFNLSLDARLVGNVVMKIIDLTGRIVYSRPLNASNDITTFVVSDLPDLPTGVYVVNCDNGNSNFKTKFTISK